MDAVEQARCEELYLRQRVASALRGKCLRTNDGDRRAGRRVDSRLDRCPKKLAVVNPNA